MPMNSPLILQQSRRAHLLAAGDWALMLTPDGSGFSRWRGLAVSRWHETGPADENGSLILLRDGESGACWSATARPMIEAAQDCRAEFGAGSARFFQRANGIETLIEIAPLPEGDGELRHLTLTNTGDSPRRIEAVSYIGLVLGAAAADAAHPAFSKMFVQTEAVEGGAILLAHRRKRDPDEPEIHAAHLVSADAGPLAMTGFETDRMRFVGRGRDLRDPAALQGPAPAGHAGTVLDPIFSLRCELVLAPGQSRHLSFWTLAGAGRAGLLARAVACRAADGDAVLAAARAMPGAPALQALAGPLLMDDPAWRAPDTLLARVAGGVPQWLWPHGISGDRPILLLSVTDKAGLDLMGELQAGQDWFRRHQLAVDLVVIAGDEGLADAARDLASAAKDQPFQTVVLAQAGLSADERDGLAAAARVILDGAKGDLAAQVAAIRPTLPAAGPMPGPAPAASTPKPPATQPTDLSYFNGFGGFAPDGREYEIRLANGACTPQPWVNVVAQGDFGFMVSAEGGGYAWAGNSQTNTLTRWSNDPVRDPPGDLIWLRDMDSARSWSATPHPLPGPGAYRIRHGFGHSRFAHECDGIASDLVQFVPVAVPVKLSHLRLRNGSARRRRVQVTGLVLWHLGANGAVTSPHVTTAHDPASGILTARNGWRADYATRLAFADLGGQQTGWTCDRAEVLGPAGDPSRPAALLSGAALSGRSGAGLSPCAALRTELDLAPGASADLVLVLGEAGDLAEARAIARQLRKADPTALLEEVAAHWRGITDRVQVKTPNDRLDLMVNGWLPYQIVSCRLQARTAFYQASGAYGFRDQLQDVSALALLAPDLARAHILRAAGRQFPEGDVQHWWLPPNGAGLRTHMADDRLWLPYVVAHHVAVTGDRGLLDAAVPFLDAPSLPADRNDDFLRPAISDESASLYEHAARAIDASLATGPHGVPLFGTGDWNDGMNRVGSKGRGESVWMGWFLLRVIADFAPLAEMRGDDARARRWHDHAARLARALEDHAWDGQHWLRGWYDDGTPLGTDRAGECRIDGIAQSWSVIAQAADPARARKAMAALERQLVDAAHGIVALLAPPFDQGGHDPGYIRGYPPGLRENGGQYTHGSVWAAIALAMLGEGGRAHDIFDMLAPVSHAASPEGIARWQVEPYVGCADVYTAPGHVGRGGWTWYTGTAGWLYRAAVEWILGLRVSSDECRLQPCIPREWPGFSLVLRWRSASYRFTVENPAGVSAGLRELTLDGAPLDAAAPIPLSDDGKSHEVRLVLG